MTDAPNQTQAGHVGDEMSIDERSATEQNSRDSRASSEALALTRPWMPKARSPRMAAPGGTCGRLHASSSLRGAGIGNIMRPFTMGRRGQGVGMRCRMATASKDPAPPEVEKGAGSRARPAGGARLR
nr:unnamed protein product [Digitaria exilis]